MHTGINIAGWRGTAIVLSCARLLLLGLATAQSARAEGNIVFAIKAVNPAQTDSTVRVSQALPKGVKPSDVIDADGMDVKYDPNSALYCVRTEEKLPAGANKEYRIVLRDIWVVPAARITELRTHASMLAGLLAKTQRKDTVVSVKQQIDDGLSRLEKWQEKYRIGANTAPFAHIQAHGRSLEILDRVIEDTGILENQAKGEGIDLPKLLGPPPPRKDGEEVASGDKPRKIRLDLSNPGRTEQKTPVKKYLPREVRPEDVTADERLEVRYDPERSACYLYSPGITVRPDEPVSIEILVADRWIVAPARYTYLDSKATNVQARAMEFKREDINNEAQQLLNRLNVVRTAERPPFSDEYVASYHKQIDELDLIEEELLKLDARLVPTQERRIFDAPVLSKVEAPSRSTTWLIVFIVIGFLFLFSVLFFLRWYGKGKDETMSG